MITINYTMEQTELMHCIILIAQFVMPTLTGAHDAQECFLSLRDAVILFI